jgi:putative transposase
MTKSAKGTIDNPGTKAKSGLNREMLRLGLSNLIQRTQDKSFRFGSQVRFVDPKFTSQICSDCGFLANADKNILMKGTVAGTRN